jgi:hypothetical protein
VREEFRQVIVEERVLSDYDGYRRLHRLVQIAARKRRAELLLSFGRAHEDEAGGRAIGRRRPHFGQIVDLPEQRVRHRAIQPFVVGPGCAKKRVEGVGLQTALKAQGILLWTVAGAVLSGRRRRGARETCDIESSCKGPTLACTMAPFRRIRERRPTGQSVGNDERLCKSGFDWPAHDPDPCVQSWLRRGPRLEAPDAFAARSFAIGMPSTNIYNCNAGVRTTRAPGSLPGRRRRENEAAARLLGAWLPGAPPSGRGSSRSRSAWAVLARKQPKLRAIAQRASRS